MSTITIVMSCISFIFAGVSFILSIILIQNKLKYDNIDEYQQSYEYEQGWKNAIEFMISNINITMFDLYRTNDVLDFDTHIDMFNERMNMLISQETYRKEVINEYNEYMKGKSK